MSTVRTTPLGKPLAQCATPLEALDELCSPLKDYAPVAPLGAAAAVEVSAEEMPADYRRLLAHERHMTLVLQEYHGTTVDLYVMDRRHEGDFYTRKIFLTKAHQARDVELGVVRLDFRQMADIVRREIVTGQTPLGAILVRHDVHRRIESRWYLRFPAGSPILAWFGREGAGPFYGRIGTIYCDHEPAIELLEIATLYR